ncbi:MULTISPECIES: shikimate dehydrogenase [Brucella]|uniref:Shikimate 5-dehydrogenase I alpha \|nr:MULTISPECIES: shikimate dehydrogenase [Brucella]MDX4071877.1 shikimate dehydrogenase [Brucella sp. NBRC 113783]SPL61808.1 Shikimate 5-dehydrogenase I alpha \
MTHDDNARHLKDLKPFPNGATRLFPVVGDPIEQVRSPEIMTELFRARGENAVVVPFHVSSSGLSAVFSTLTEVDNVGGLLVTIPHKQQAFQLCTGLTDNAVCIEAVNVVRRVENGWYGDNTDGVGFLNGIEREGFDVQGKTVLLVGCGGAGTAIGLEMLRRGAARLAIHDVDGEKRDSVIRKLDACYTGKVAMGSDDPSGFDLIANATPMGLKSNDPLPVNVTKLRSEQFAACVITKPHVSPFIEEARKRGCQTMIGAGMFDAQAEVLADFLTGQYGHLHHSGRAPLPTSTKG